MATVKDLVTTSNASGPRSSEILTDPDPIPAIRMAVNAALLNLHR